MGDRGEVVIKGPKKGISGDIRVPGDKSISHRAVILSAIADGSSRVYGLLKGEDVLCTVKAFEMMGIKIDDCGDDALLIHGRGINGLCEPDDVIYAGNSGTTMRLLSGLLSGQDFFSVITGDPSLRTRPMKRVVQPLRTMSARIWGRKRGENAPLAILGGGLDPIQYRLPVASAQVKSAIILAGLYADGTTEIEETARSRDHTEVMLKHMGACIEIKDGCIHVKGGDGLKANDIAVPGDISSAAFFIVAALLLPHSSLTIRGVGLNPTRTGIINILKRMGASIELDNVEDRSGEAFGDIIVKNSALNSVNIGAEDVPFAIDEFPIICVAASLAEGVTEISGASELRKKESDRIAVMTGELRKFGVRIEEKEDGLVIEGRERLKGAMCDTHGDHRVAMALYVAGLAAEGETVIGGCQCVRTSFPDFFELMENVIN